MALICSFPFASSTISTSVSPISTSLTETAIFHAKRAIARAHPELDHAERDLMFIEIHYGKELADQVREYTRER